jgi:small subunit ribosomal protein S5
MRIQDGFEEKIIEVKRVSKKSSGGNKISFTAMAVVGDKAGKIGTALAKALDVSSATSKALSKARKNVISVNINENTIPHEVLESYKSSTVKLMPAPRGSGIIAGSAVRDVLHLCGVKDVSAKMLGSNNKNCAVICTINALKRLEKRETK